MSGWLRIVALAVCAIEAGGQVTSLATDRNGSVVFFSSAAALKGIENGVDSRIYLLRPGQPPALAAELPQRHLERGLNWPQASAENGILVWTEEDQCTCCSGCWERQRHFARMFASDGSVLTLGFGDGAISANGRWVSWGGGTGLVRARMGWRDLRTGETFEHPWSRMPPPSPGARVVSDEGARIVY